MSKIAIGCSNIRYDIKQKLVYCKLDNHECKLIVGCKCKKKVEVTNGMSIKG